jgi:hypothetical protein
LLVAGVVKGGYDVALWRWSRRVPRIRLDQAPDR